MLLQKSALIWLKVPVTWGSLLHTVKLTIQPINDMYFLVNDMISDQGQQMIAATWCLHHNHKR